MNIKAAILKLNISDLNKKLILLESNYFYKYKFIFIWKNI